MFLPVCKYHIILLGEIEELQHKLDTLCFIYQYVDSWTASIHCSSTDSSENLLQKVESCLTMCREQSALTKETESGQNAEYCKKDALETKV